MAITEESRQERRRARSVAVVALHQAGAPIPATRKKLGVSRPTVRQYVRTGTFPDWPARRTPVSAGTSYGACAQKRGAEGDRDAAVLWEELRAQGLSGSLRPVPLVVAGWREESRPRWPRRARHASRSPPCSPRCVACRRAKPLGCC